MIEAMIVILQIVELVVLFAVLSAIRRMAAIVRRKAHNKYDKLQWTSYNGQATQEGEKMRRYVDSEPDTAGEEYALLIGRIEAVTAFIEVNGTIDKSLFFNMMGFDQEGEDTV